MKLQKLFQSSFIAASLLLSFSAQAGWVSGGGELVQDAQNPWFLMNTTEVKYCILIDETNFGQSLGAVRERIGRALEFWKIQFQNTAINVVLSPYMNFRLATQNFREVSCSEEPALRFQFGILTGEQIQKIGNPTHYVGLSVRTDYDKVNLRGKGFVYISPQSGPLKFDLIKNKKNDWRPWSESSGALLLPVLIHELGHVFGVPHNDDVSLMGEREMERLVVPPSNQNFSNSKYWESIERDNSFLKFRLFVVENNFDSNSFMICQINESVPVEPVHPVTPRAFTAAKAGSTADVFERFFHLKENENCRNYRIRSNKFTLSVKNPAASDRIVGEAKLTVQNFNTDLKSVVKLWMPEEQKVFQLMYYQTQLQTAVMMQRSQKYKGRFEFADGSRARDILLTATASGQTMIGGELDGVLYFDLNSGF